MSIYLVWVGEGEALPHYAALDADAAQCGMPNSGGRDRGRPDLSTPVCPVYLGKATGR